MKTFSILLLVVAVAVGGYLLGRRSQGPEAPTAAPTVDAAAPASSATVAPPLGEDATSKLPSSQPVRTFRGPDGLPHLIVYDQTNPPDKNDPDQVRAAMLEDMKNHPRNIVRSYDLTREQVDDIVAGRKPFPPELLPKPRK